MAYSVESQAENGEEIRDLLSTKVKLQIIVERANRMAFGLDRMDSRFKQLNGGVSATAMAVAPLQSAAMVAKALDTRIERAINPALRVLEKFGQLQELHTTIADMLLQQQSQGSKYSGSRVDRVQDLIESFENLELLVGLLRDECEPAIQRLQEAVEFLCRTKATDYYRAHRLRETLSTLRALYENEVEDLTDGLLMEKALSRLEYEFTRMLEHIGKRVLQKTFQEVVSVTDRPNDDLGCLDLASKQEIEVLRRIVEVMRGYDRIEGCIDSYVQVRWRRAAKSLMRLKLDYLLNFGNIDEMEWEALESSIRLWIEHFKIAVKVVLASEKELCRQIFGDEDLVFLSECVGRVGRKVMAAFLRFGNGVTRSRKQPQKLFKLLEIFESMEGLKHQFYEIFGGEGGKEICLEFRELHKQVVNAACKVFWEFGLLVEGQQDGTVPPEDGSVPKLVKYAVGYMESLAGDYYAPLMTKVLKIEQLWKSPTPVLAEGSLKGFEGSPKTLQPLGELLVGGSSQNKQISNQNENQNQNRFCEAVSNFMEALQRNLNSKCSAYRNRALAHLFIMNSQWYIYTRTKNTQLGKLVGITGEYKQAAERAGYLYQKEAWGHCIELLSTEGLDGLKPNIRSLVRQRLKYFMTEFEDTYQRHKSYSVKEKSLSEQIRISVSQSIVPAYENFLEWLGQGEETASLLYEDSSMVSPDSIQKMLGELFVGKTGKEKTENVVRRSVSLTSKKTSPSKAYVKRTFSPTPVSSNLSSSSPRPSFRSSRTRNI
ncbi:hypothetical protein SUGI_0320650 [Cryptomeria japonica]|uniref:exocyst complex component EXO70I n=1 Tax=Cryptomeria japonica TaxID=3369 RepID=UPI002408B239|nr:exocyst complex component EXO70I [Cryptomeria japonica]GLJ18150.1 hypothetical protein SUGI_0320650 [Cryptomeria japonica]